MLYQVTIPFTSQKGLRYGWSSASLLHGVLMETIAPEAAEVFHAQTVRPFSQSVEWTEDGPAWVIRTLTQEAFSQIVPPLLALRTAEVAHRDDVLTFGTPALRRISYDDLFREHYILHEPARLIKMDILTPTAFKSGGVYLNMPTPRLLLLGAARRYDALCSTHGDGYESDEDAFAEEIGARVSITSYRLRSTAFPLEQIRIPAFTGTLTLRLGGNEIFRRYLNMICAFASYSGIGIKTALGMGMVRCVPLTEKGGTDGTEAPDHDGSPA